MTDISSIPLNKLVDSAENVRKTAGADSALQELTASIAAHALRQPRREMTMGPNHWC